MRTLMTTVAVLSAAVGVHVPVQAEPIPARGFEGEYSITSLGVPPGVAANLGGLTIIAGDPNTLYVAGHAETADGAIYTVTVLRDRDGHVIGFDGPATVQSAAPGLHGGGINGSLIAFFDHSHHLGALLSFLTSDNCFGTLREGTSSPWYIQDLMNAFGDGTAVAHAIVPCGFPHRYKPRVITENPTAWHEALYFLTQAGLPLIAAKGDPIMPLDGGPRSIVYVKGSNPGFDGEDVVLIAKRDAARIDGYRIDDHANPLGATEFPFIIDIAGVEGMVVDPVTDDLLVSTSPADGSTGNEILVIRGFAPCLPGELTGDDEIDAADLAVLLSLWGDCGDCVGLCGTASLNCDCDIDGEDLAILLANWGPCR